ncbi:50S ribosomal protein L13 [[Clostridium] sordellii]|uniref:Large ribosomal subunit protein uL13 n=1 Tax=Paraclostridium sordellii TaxID=1505 RepID=A0A0A1S293_PARSO|nr:MULTISPECIES: 50S ribosomal protein L13 [Paeniclostridium]EPZ61435.1 ribosomal protein L13 [[Clostridium] sordellii ATCC 9714] [Paeniclostridium sordellii ATCC 9714]MDU5020938.1 50S ribosomal protein L13 [Clostridiales bacterium]MDU7904661.1 50S ribosomal protein L13 [Peptostreptococcaceae bacterium]AUN12888.1 50S ribosomal protein L13 [Paeniclostridium sordellii]EPZ61372.1 ribosomal protein L13 [[Clostridium] sordellii VPI 9048] [Paeniclostridium sordellii VPI 9048]
MKSYIAKPADVQRKWYVVDAEGKTLGRMATEIATILRGKHKPTFTPHVDGGDFVVVVNADKVVLTGKKLDQKMYRYHTGYVGGLKEITYREMMEKKPEEVVMHAVSGMLCKNRLRSRMMTRLRVFAGPNHGHEAQNPEVLNFK